MKQKKIFSIIFPIIFIAGMLFMLSGCGSGGGGDEGASCKGVCTGNPSDDSGQPGNVLSGNSAKPEIAWIKPIDYGLSIAGGNYEGGGLRSFSTYAYFEVTGNSGDIEISADLEGDGTTSNTFSVESGQVYRVKVLVLTPGGEQNHLDPFAAATLSEISVDFSSPHVTTIENVSFMGYHRTYDMSLGEMSVEPWDLTLPDWQLTVRIKESVGTVSDSNGVLEYNETENVYTGYYEHGTKVTLTLDPAPGYVFDYWYGTVGSTSSETASSRDKSTTITFTMGVSVYLEPRFK